MSDQCTINVTVNGELRSAEVEPRRTLVDFLRHDLRLYGTHVGCEQGACGACTVQVDGKAIKSCLMLAVQADGHEVRTVESLAGNGPLHPLQEVFFNPPPHTGCTAPSHRIHSTDMPIAWAWCSRQ